jgi:hypothetical protein
MYNPGENVYRNSILFGVTIAAAGKGVPPLPNFIIAVIELLGKKTTKGLSGLFVVQTMLISSALTTAEDASKYRESSLTIKCKLLIWIL